MGSENEVAAEDAMHPVRVRFETVCGCTRESIFDRGVGVTIVVPIYSRSDGTWKMRSFRRHTCEYSTAQKPGADWHPDNVLVYREVLDE